jgi:hypothetical protein
LLWHFFFNFDFPYQLLAMKHELLPRVGGFGL